MVKSPFLPASFLLGQAISLSIFPLSFYSSTPFMLFIPRSIAIYFLLLRCLFLDNPISRFLFPLPKSAILVLPDPNRLSSFTVCPASALFYPATIRLTFSIFSPQVFSPFGKSNALILLARPVLFCATPGRCPRFSRLSANLLSRPCQAIKKAAQAYDLHGCFSV